MMLAWQAFIRWKSLLAGSARFLDRDRFRVYRVSGGSTQQDVPPLLKKYFPDVEPGRSLKDFSLTGLLSGKYRLAGRPDKRNLSFFGKVKRFVVRHFLTDYE
ncbi:hypothetical protein NB646_05175 [Oxalobacter aliiformigenes]|uniref:Uncharacterized protein n=1 Tax=Oxalobacter aliiformigenes TaxID=2946593 RepID=A0A9E9LG27_9BURK|nr:hypothetical protein [Oxalobacter aliiformigenes]WAV92109.1 hypothetical protein NB646_05175 [Oxalobacter aliiformigenes]